MDFDWKSVVKAISPVLGTALAGPFGGIAGKVLADAVLGDENASLGDLEKAILSANPETAAAVKQAEYAFLAKMEEAGVKREQIAADDRDSARKREIAIRDGAPLIIGSVVLTGFFGTLAALVLLPVPVETENLVYALLGGLVVMAKDVISYYFGSSAGSKRKTEAIAERISH